jgi:hypothetical protein
MTNKKYSDPNYVRKPFIIVPDPFKDFSIPDTWNNVEEFADWWLSLKMPLIFPTDPEVYMSDDATAISLFRKDRFQVELYLIHPKPKVPVHEHPGVEVIKVRAGHPQGLGLSAVLRLNESHGSGMKLEAERKGFPLLAIQHWLTREPTTIASMWKGYTVGPLHQGLITRYNPGCLIDGNYADITKNADGTDRSF